MSAAWGKATTDNQPTEKQKRLIRMWGYLAFAGVFLVYVALRLNVKLF